MLNKIHHPFWSWLERRTRSFFCASCDFALASLLPFLAPQRRSKDHWPCKLLQRFPSCLATQRTDPQLNCRGGCISWRIYSQKVQLWRLASFQLNSQMTGVHVRLHSMIIEDGRETFQVSTKENGLKTLFTFWKIPHGFFSLSSCCDMICSRELSALQTHCRRAFRREGYVSVSFARGVCATLQLRYRRGVEAILPTFTCYLGNSATLNQKMRKANREACEKKESLVCPCGQKKKGQVSWKCHQATRFGIGQTMPKKERSPVFLHIWTILFRENWQRMRQRTSFKRRRNLHC